MPGRRCRSVRAKIMVLLRNAKFSRDFRSAGRFAGRSFRVLRAERVFRAGFRGPVFAGRSLPAHLSGILREGEALTARLAGLTLIVRLAEGASQSRFCRASLGLADGSEPSGRGGTTMRLLGRRGFGPGRLLTGSGFGLGVFCPAWLWFGAALNRHGFGTGRLQIPGQLQSGVTGSPPTRSGRGRRSRWP